MSSLTYYSNIPQATDNPSNSQPQILQNFTAINQWTGVDHVAFGSAGSQDGYHNRVSFPAAGNQTIPANAKALIDTAQQASGNYNGYLLPFYTATNGATPISVPMIPNITSQAQGYYAFNGQMLTYFGSDHILVNTNTFTLTFTVPFPTPHLVPSCVFSFGLNATAGIISYVLTGIAQNGSFQATSVTIEVSNAATVGTIPVYWICTGF